MGSQKSEEAAAREMARILDAPPPGDPPVQVRRRRVAARGAGEPGTLSALVRTRSVPSPLLWGRQSAHAAAPVRARSRRRRADPQMNARVAQRRERRPPEPKGAGSTPAARMTENHLGCSRAFRSIRNDARGDLSGASHDVAVSFRERLERGGEMDERLESPEKEPLAVRRARAYGTDIGLLRALLLLPWEERIRRLEENLSDLQTAKPTGRRPC
jgi:hypothetical protein